MGESYELKQLKKKVFQSKFESMNCCQWLCLTKTVRLFEMVHPY